MKMLDYVKSLIGDFDKERIFEEIRLTNDELRSVTIPAYKEAEKVLSKTKPQSPAVKAKVTVYESLVKKRKQNIITTIYQALLTGQANIASIERLIDKTFADDIVAAGITYQKANLLQYVEVVHFASRYARRFLNFYYVAETAMYDDQVSMEEALVPADLNWVHDNFNNFCQILNVLSHSTQELERAIANIPDVVVDTATGDAYAASVGARKVDPLQMGFIPVWLNPVFHIRMFKAEWQTNRYHQAKQEIKCLQLRKSHLEALANGKPNAKVQKEIEYIESRVQGLMAKNAELEQRYLENGSYA